MYKSKYFKIDEFMPVEYRGNKLSENIKWGLLDSRILQASDMVRELYGVCFVNITTQNINQAGFRILPVEAKFSQHLFGRAVDLHIAEIEKKNFEKEKKIEAYNLIRQQLLKNLAFHFCNFEDNVSWLHIDVGNRENRVF
jgi:hypothetical protein